VHGSQVTVDHVGWKYVPRGFTAAQLNLAYCVATLLIDGEVFVDQFTKDKLTDPARMMLAEKVEVRHDPAITARGRKFRQMVRVEVHLKDGKVLERTREVSRAKENFAPESEIVDKFDKLASRVLPKRQVEELRDAVLGLDRVDDAAKIARLMTKH
jgi:aconitate decarboxylase